MPTTELFYPFELLFLDDLIDDFETVKTRILDHSQQENESMVILIDGWAKTGWLSLPRKEKIGWL
jgi:hypothetical protein